VAARSDQTLDELRAQLATAVGRWKMTAAEVNTFFEAYADAFSREDVERI